MIEFKPNKVLAQIEPMEHDNFRWIHRHVVLSADSGYAYLIAQHRTKRFWGCTCLGFKEYKHCKHLRSLKLPGDKIPYEVTNNN